MAKDSRKVSGDEAVCADEATSLETLIRRRARGLIDAIVDEELEAALGAAESARVGLARQGYRHGSRERTLTTSLGPTTFAMPRARVKDGGGRDRRMAERHWCRGINVAASRSMKRFLACI